MSISLDQIHFMRSRIQKNLRGPVKRRTKKQKLIPADPFQMALFDFYSGVRA